MSAIGTKRTYRVALHMSAFGGKVDIIRGKADIDQRTFVTNVALSQAINLVLRDLQVAG